MRLGDLDALYDCVEARYRISSGEEHKAERALLDAICDSPAVDAIPMEWLRNMMLECEAEESRAAWVVMREWRKWKQEQEAHQ